MFTRYPRAKLCKTRRVMLILSSSCDLSTGVSDEYTIRRHHVA